MPALYLFSSLSSFELGGIPLPWIGTALAFPSALGAMWLLGTRGDPLPGWRTGLVFAGLAALVTLRGSLTGHYSALMPSGSTTPYWLYVLLRVLVLVGFLCVGAVTYRLCQAGFERAVIRGVVTVGVVLAALAIYAYFAQVHDFPDLPRNRLGTDGDPPAVRFSYPVHRAMGTFREPGQLAEWLVVPFFLSFAVSRRPVNVPGVVIGTALALSGGLTGIAAASVGFVGAAVLTWWRGRRTLRDVGRVGLVVAISLLAFRVLAVPYLPYSTTFAFGRKDAPIREAARQAAGQASAVEAPEAAAFPAASTPGLLTVLQDRVRGALTRGAGVTGRGNILEFILSRPVSVIGPGLGNVNLELTQVIGMRQPVSLLSLYANVLLGVGAVGLPVLLVLLGRPLVVLTRRRAAVQGDNAVWIAAGYVAWLVIFAVDAEEFTAPFGVIFGVLTHEVWRLHQYKERTQPMLGPWSR